MENKLWKSRFKQKKFAIFANMRLLQKTYWDRNLLIALELALPTFVPLQQCKI